MSLRFGIFFIRAATVAGLGNNIFPVPPKNFTRSLGMSTITSSWGSILSFSHPSCYPASPAQIPRDDQGCELKARGAKEIGVGQRCLLEAVVARNIQVITSRQSPSCERLSTERKAHEKFRLTDDEDNPHD